MNRFLLCLCLLVACGSAVRAQDAPRLVAQTGHAKAPEQLAVSDDGKLALSVAGNVVLWQVATKRELRSWEPRGADYAFAAFVPSPKKAEQVRVVLADKEGGLSLWDGATGSLVRRFSSWKGTCSALVVAPDGASLWAAGWDNQNRKAAFAQFAIASGEALRREELAVQALAVSRDGQWLALGYENGHVSLRDGKSFAEAAVFDSGFSVLGRFEVAFSPDATTLAVSSPSKAGVRLFAVPSGEPKRTLDGYGPCVWSADGRSLLLNRAPELGAKNAPAKNITLLDVGTDKATTWTPSDQTFSTSYHCAARLRDGRFWVAGGVFDVNSHVEDSVFLDPRTQGVEVGLRGVTRSTLPCVVSVTDDGTQLMLGDGLWNVAEGRFSARVSDQTSSIELGPDAQMVWLSTPNPQARLLTQKMDSILGDTIKGIQLWQVEPNAFGRASVFTELAALPGRAPLALSRDGTLIAARSLRDDDTAPVRLWRLAAPGASAKAGEPLTLGQAKDAPQALAFSPDGATLVAVGREIVWFDAITGALKRRVRPSWLDDVANTATDDAGTSAQVAFSPDGARVIVAQSPFLLRATCFVSAFDAATGKPLWSVQLDDWGHSLAFSPDGARLLLGGFKGIHEFDAASGRAGEPFSRQAETSAVTALAPSGDGKWLWSGNDDGTVRLWNARSSALVGTLRWGKEGTWLFHDENGHFDTNAPDNVPFLCWVVPSRPFEAWPVETFFRQGFEPRLLSRLLNGETIPPVRSGVPRALPRVEIVSVSPKGGLARVEVRVHGEPNTHLASVHLKREGVLCRSLDPAGGTTLDAQGEASVVFERVSFFVRGVLDAQGSVDHHAHSYAISWSAYAFTPDGARSETARLDWEPPLPADYKENTWWQQAPRAFVVTLGVNDYQDPRWKLSFAAPDATALGDELERSLKTVASSVTRLSLVANGRKGALLPTKANIRALLQALSGQAVPAELRAKLPALKAFPPGPNDLVIVTFSGHGSGDSSGRFFLFPQDIGSHVTQLSPAFLATKCVSSDELASWLRDVDAGQIALVLDCCHSAGAVQTPEFKPAPSNARGLAQLAYDKGILVLAASGADDVALESGQLKHGLLSYALALEGLSARRAATESTKSFQEPSISLRGWLSYGRSRVGPLLGEVRRGSVQPLPGRGAPEITLAAGARLDAPADGQRPFLFDFNTNSASTLIWQHQTTLDSP